MIQTRDRDSSTKFLKLAYLPLVVAQNHTRETKTQETPLAVPEICSADLLNLEQVLILITTITDSRQTQFPNLLQLKFKP